MHDNFSMDLYLQVYMLSTSMQWLPWITSQEIQVMGHTLETLG